jgi:hypothetical protein
MQAKKGKKAQLYSCLNSALGGAWVVKATPQLLYSSKRPAVYVLQKVGSSPGSVWTEKEKRNLCQYPVSNP